MGASKRYTRALELAQWLRGAIAYGFGAGDPFSEESPGSRKVKLAG